MRILVLNHYAGSDNYGMEFRPFYLGREMVKQGHEVTVIAASFSHLRSSNPKVAASFDEEMLDGVRYVYLKAREYQKNDVRRFFNMMDYLHQLKSNAERIYRTFLPDVIIASSTYPYDVKAAKKIASYGENVKVCYEIHDIWPLSLIELYHLSTHNPYIASLQRAENYAYQNADMVISILPDVDKHIKELGFQNVNYLHIPNGILTDPADFLPAPDEIVNTISQLTNDGKFILMYLGGFAKANALDDLMEAAKEMNPGIQVVLAGKGALKAEYEAAAKEYQNITILPGVSKRQVNAVLSLADALYIGAKKSGLYAYGVGMNKLFDYMLAKKPILYAIESSNNPVRDADCGITAEAENPKSIAEAAGKLAAMEPSKRIALGENGYRYVKENHDYQKLAVRLSAALQELCSKGSEEE